MSEISQVSQNGFVGDRTDEPCFCLISPSSATGISNLPWLVFFISPDSGLPTGLGGGVGPGKATSSTPLAVNGGTHTLFINYVGEEEDAEFTINLFCQRGDEIYSEQQITFTWGDRLETSIFNLNGGLFTLHLPTDCELRDGGEVG